MVRSTLLLLFVTLLSEAVLAAAQQPTRATEPAGDRKARRAKTRHEQARYPDPEREELIPGFPVGQPGPMHPQARWQLGPNVFMRTATRYRISLEGLWRFGPVFEKDERPDRSGMGWLKLPLLWTDPEAVVYDASHRIAEGRWMGIPLEQISTAWLERELYATSSWISKLVYLTVRAPWHDAAVHVNAEPVAPISKQQAQAVYDITSYLVYPGWSLIDLKKHTTPKKTGPLDDIPLETPAPQRAVSTARTYTEAKPAIYIDLIPAGPHFESIRVRSDGHRTWLAECRLGLPPIFAFPVRPDDPVPQFELVITARGSKGQAAELLRQRFALRRRPRKPLRFEFSMPKEAPPQLDFYLYEFVDGKRVLRDQFYPITLQRSGRSEGKPEGGAP